MPEGRRGRLGTLVPAGQLTRGSASFARGLKKERAMAIDLTVALIDQPGSLAKASDALGRAGVNIDGACGYVCDGQGTYHVLVHDLERARRALMNGAFIIEDERRVVAVPVAN